MYRGNRVNSHFRIIYRRISICILRSSENRRLSENGECLMHRGHSRFLFVPFKHGSRAWFYCSLCRKRARFSVSSLERPAYEAIAHFAAAVYVNCYPLTRTFNARFWKFSLYYLSIFKNNDLHSLSLSLYLCLSFFNLLQDSICRKIDNIPAHSCDDNLFSRGERGA